MPANLSPQYRAAEAAYRRAQSEEEELSCLLDMLRLLPKHKGTDRLHGELKAKISKLKQSQAAKGTSGSSAKTTLKIPKQGAGRVLLLGLPNSGKSQLLVSLTRASTEISEVPMTTRMPVPGMMYYEDCPIQLIEIPSIVPQAFDASVLDWVRNADFVLIAADVTVSHWIEDLQSLLGCFSQGKTRLGIPKAESPKIRGGTTTPALILLNKVENSESQSLLQAWNEFDSSGIPALAVSGKSGVGLDGLRERIFRELQAVRVYPHAGEEGRRAETTKVSENAGENRPTPWVIRRGESLKDVALCIHADFLRKTSSARVWNNSLHPGTIVKLDYEPSDGDEVEFICR